MLWVGVIYRNVTLNHIVIHMNYQLGQQVTSKPRPLDKGSEHKQTTHGHTPLSSCLLNLRVFQTTEG